MKIKLVFDSTIVLNAEEAKKYNVAITPFIINDNGKIYHDNVDIKPMDFYGLWEKNNRILTSQPNIGETTELFNEILKEYDHIIYFTIPEVLSGTYATGKMIAQEIGESKISVVDAGTGVGAFRVMAEVGNKMIEEGKSVEEIIEHLEKAKDNSRLFVLPANMDGLKAGGRVNNITASIFGMIKLKIGLYLAKSGYIEKYEISRTDSKMISRIISKVKQDIGSDDLIIYLIYTDDKSLLDTPTETIKKEFPNSQFEYMELSPTLGAHTGPKTISFHFCKKHW
ncbi:DegV family protein with EDD domain [Bacilli bacterium PM5-3]|nr:DegV family protein with EDD domain [Bacilli bacterium PM5-3]